MALVRQHLIDPEICIRCNTCQEACPDDAITHDSTNYVIDFEKCTNAGDCMLQCPTGAIDSFRMIAEPWSTDDQYGWDALPEDQVFTPPASQEIPDDVARITEIASEGAGGRELPPLTAPHPYVGLYTPDRPAIAKISGNLRLTGDESDVDIRHIVLDLGKSVFPVLEGQSIGILPPGVDAEGRPHHVRLYSVASPRDGERPGFNNVALTIKRITEDADGNPVHGVASNYLCDLEKGSEVHVTGPFGSTFLMPDDPNAKIIMICTGTGSAPFRAMTERRRRHRTRGVNGSLHLFFGARRPDELPYFGPLKKLPGSLIDVDLAFSREPGRDRQYVQDRLRDRAEDVAHLLDDDQTYLYICGHKRMEAGVSEALADICAGHGMHWETLSKTMRDGGRLHLETYH
ncbi:MAG: benzoyl-CoA 2,3-dioxygenase component A [Paracoccaceae bacterium]|jgi:benzoyl-CoA 2,3-dioxygenase component A